MSSETLLRVEALAKAYVPAKPVFADVSFTLQRAVTYPD